MNAPRIIVVGGGAAGFFAAITCAEAAPDANVIILERSAAFLAKVRISGGGRCNVTHNCFDPRELAAYYPRGGQAMIGPFQRFQPRDTIAWFAQRGVQMYTQPDGCLFPTTDSSQTIIDSLLHAAKTAGVKLRTRCGVENIRCWSPAFRLQPATDQAKACTPTTDGFELTLTSRETLTCDRLLLATGGCRTAAAGKLATMLGHTLEPPVPSLFTFNVATPWLRSLAGLVIDPVEVSVPGTKLHERGILLITHTGLSGPAILRLSAWGARPLHDRNYHFLLHINWLPGLPADAFDTLRQHQPAKLVLNTPLSPLPARLWEQLVLAAGIDPQTRWSRFSKSDQHRLTQQLTRTELQVTGKNLNKEEFVTCGGVRLSEVNFKTMESRLCPGLHFAGELLDIDGLTGGYNFQAAWTTGWIAGQAMAR